MTTNVDEVAALIVLKDNILQRLDQKFGSSDLFDLDEMLSSMLVYHDMHELLRKPGVLLGPGQNNRACCKFGVNGRRVVRLKLPDRRDAMYTPDCCS